MGPQSVPALVLLLGLPITLAVGTSLLVITLTSGAALAAHLASGSIDWTIASTFTGAAIAGALAGRRLGVLPTDVLNAADWGSASE